MKHSFFAFFGSLAIALMISISIPVHSQKMTTTGNACNIYVLTPDNEHHLTTSGMKAELDFELGRFEFAIPKRTVKSSNGSSSTRILSELTDGQDIVIYAYLPDNDDAVSGLSYFKSLNAIQLIGQLHLGKSILPHNISFTNIQVNLDHNITFDFEFMVDTRSIPLKPIVANRVLQICIESVGVQIIAQKPAR